MRKEIVIWCSTNEQDEEIKVQIVTADPEFLMLTLGPNRMVIKLDELLEAVGAIGHYSTLFTQEQKMREARDASRAASVLTLTPTDFDKVKTTIANPAQVNTKLKKALKNKEDEGTLVLEAPTRTGPTASELALEKQMKLMQGDSLVFKKDE